MLYNTFNQYYYSIDYYAVSTTGDVNNPVLTWTFDRQVKAKVIMDGTARVFIHVPPEEALQINGRFRNIRDRDGQLLIPIPGTSYGQEYQISEAEPIANQFGYRVDIRYWGVKV